ncbi:MAG: ABC transporter substrate-binding protein [Verrucomicrobiales bacterium]|jgi:sulfonate transport system substrate-binding protein|nr:ABC transporter substrate-binding protein [Verrucomicrobiales bacterium]
MQHKLNQLIITLALTLTVIAGVSVTASAVEVAGKPRVAKLPLQEWTAVAAQKGWLQEEFAKYNAKVEIVNVSAMNIAGVEASLLDRGDLHFALRMQYPSLQHKLNGLDAVVVWQSGDAPVRRNTIVVLNDAPYHKLEDLKGTKFGSWRISCPYFGAYEVFKKGGVPLDTDFAKGDIRFVNITGQAQTSSFLAGQLASITGHPGSASYAALYTQGLIKELSASVPGGVYLRGGGRTSWFVPRVWARENPDLVKAFLIAYQRTRLWVKDNPDAAATIVARETRIPKHIANYIIKDDSSYAFVAGQPSQPDAVSAIKLFQQWAYDNGDDFIKRKRLTDAQIEQFIDKRFFEGGEYFVYTGDDPNYQPKSAAVTVSGPPVAAAHWSNSNNH